MRSFSNGQKTAQICWLAKWQTGRYGKSVIEVLLVTILLLLIAGIIAPLILRTRESARATQCQNNLRILTMGLRAYHDTHGVFPAAAVWRSVDTQSLALHRARRVDQFTFENWAQSILPHVEQISLSNRFDASVAIGAEKNLAARTTQFSGMRCVSDIYNRADNPYRFYQAADATRFAEFARGNYAINGGTHNMELDSPSTMKPRGDTPHLLLRHDKRLFQMWGNGVAGINKSFSADEFTNGQATLVAIEEVRSGIDPLDARGVWAMGQIGGSITWGHGVNGDAYGPNSQWPRSDDIFGCGALHQEIGTEKLMSERMPCVDYVDQNQQATARSMHADGVYVSFIDGSVRFVNDAIDPGLWHVIHSRETPEQILKGKFEETLGTCEFSTESIAVIADGPAVNSGTMVNSLGMTFAFVPGGKFQMGISDQNTSDPPPEVPVHTVEVNSFLLAVHEVSTEQFRKVMSRDESSAELLDKLPVTDVTWNAAMQFCERLSQQPLEKSAGRVYRLPTEAEWEFACREGKSKPYEWRPFRSPDDHSGAAAGIQPPLPLLPIGSFAPNEFGLHDMRGNAWEWTSDWFDRDYYTRSPVKNPQGPAYGFLKVVRGSDWRFTGEPCHIDLPMLTPWKGNPFVGFRVVCCIATGKPDETPVKAKN